MIMSPRRLAWFITAATVGFFLACSVAVATAKAQDTVRVHVIQPERPRIAWGPDTVIPVHTIYIKTGSPAMHKLDVAMLTTKVEMLFIATKIEAFSEDGSQADSIFEILDVRQCDGIGYKYSMENTDCGNDHASPTIHLHLWRHDCGPSRTDLRSQIEDALLDPRHRVDLTYCGFNTGGSAYWLSRNPLEPSRWRGAK